MTAPAVPRQTLAEQHRASHPAASAWVSANAGSGKTHVLAQRVIRLLLGGVPPSRILCLTFTKAAAANMSIRVFETLASWTRLDDEALGGAIVGTGAPPPGPVDREAARRLFARTVETPGGLKIQTIHAFCERLLQLFPFEANVPARFEVLDEARAADLRARAVEAALAQADLDAAAPLARAVAVLARETSEQGFEKLLAEALKHRAALHAANSGGADFDTVRESLGNLFGARAGDTAERLVGTILEDGIPASEWAAMARKLGADGGDARKAANRLAAAAAATSPAGQADAYCDVVLSKGQPREDKYLPKALRNAEPGLCARLDAERDRLPGLLVRLVAARTAERSAALAAVAGAVLARYDRAKRARGWLDFEDLVERTRTLLGRSDAAWVLYKLDRGIDHILVDEAQDTSPGQWEILRAISEDFYAGAGREGATRTIFAVGDEKQSIYGFQGARPDMFAAMRAHFQDRAMQARLRFESVDLLLSFRSARAVLAAVDRVFAHPANARGLVADPAGPRPHEPLRQMPGLVELWPVVLAEAAEEPADWRLPVDVAEPRDPAVVVARRVAQLVARLCAPESGETVEDNRTRARRPVRPGDVMILVRSRAAFFEAMIRALKDRGVPVAGADRLTLTEHIAVMDLMAAGRAALAPGDDFTLACALKSPLLGLDDDDLMALAPGRGGPLITALERSGEPRHREAAARLARWRSAAASRTPFSFYSRLLGAEGGRRRLLGRLGPESADAIDEFLALALAHERDGAPSLLGFLARLETVDMSIKRDMEAAGDAVRVMTVHAAKGLEAKIVVLPDTCTVPDGKRDGALFLLAPGEPGDGGETASALAWSPRQDADPPPVASARQDGRRRALDEHNRLLYVAMTRAEERLYVAGFSTRPPPDGSWYRMIEAADIAWASEAAPWDPTESVRRFSDGPPAPVDPGPDVLPAVPPELPAWLFRAAPAAAEADAPPLRPSNPLGAADGFAPVAWTFADRHRGGRAEAVSTGRLMHRLLEHLPDVAADRREAASLRFLAQQGRSLSEDKRGDLARHAAQVLADPALAPLFAPGSRAEVAIAALVTLPSGRVVEVAGQIDRIGVADAAIFIADYKTGAPSATIEARHALQLALYAAAVAPLYPGRPVRAFLVWTATAQTIEIDAASLDSALRTLG